MPIRNGCGILIYSAGQELRLTWIKYHRMMNIVNVLKFQTLYDIHFSFAYIYFFMHLHVIHKILGGKANSVDPDQTAPKKQSDLGLHCLHMLFY